MVNKIPLYFNTLRHVKPTQLYHQIYYRLKSRLGKSGYDARPSKVAKLKFEGGILYPLSYKATDTFTFLNLEKDFSKIDWNFSEYGKLWTYNLNYFEFLQQEEMKKEEGLKLIRDYNSSRDTSRDGTEPYPISLRGINWIKFLVEHELQDKEINTFLYRDYLRLLDHLEYHLLANHLLENGFSLLFGAYYFEDDRLYKRAKKILVRELEEQILQDGAHYELSPMYHQIILHRVLDSINMVKNNAWKGKELLSLLQKKAELMLGWLEEISFKNGEIPKLNDSSTGIAPTTRELKEYAVRMGVETKQIRLNESGYRKLKVEDLEFLIDVGQIAPKYQPAHSHSDSLQFVFNYKSKPIVVDTGISTYEKNERRQLERSTSAHNTVAINDTDSSEVWGGFRVARRAKVILMKDTATEVEASHDGYKKFGFLHRRKWFVEKSAVIKIEDDILREKSSDKNFKAKGFIHFHPDLNPRIEANSIHINEEMKIELEGAVDIKMEDYYYAEAFNKLINAKKASYIIKNKVLLSICFQR